jgi:hypothetical protein
MVEKRSGLVPEHIGHCVRIDAEQHETVGHGDPLTCRHAQTVPVFTTERYSLERTKHSNG